MQLTLFAYTDLDITCGLVERFSSQQNTEPSKDVSSKYQQHANLMVSSFIVAWAFSGKLQGHNGAIVSDWAQCFYSDS